MIAFIQNAIRLCVVFLFGSTGETITEKSGHLNMGIPGVMCLGATGGALGIKIYLNTCGGNVNAFMVVFVAIIFALIFGSLCGLLFSFFCVSLRCNQNVVGLTLTTFGTGFYVLLFQILGEEGYTSVKQYFYSFYNSGAQLNWFEQIFLSYGPLVFLAIIISILAAIIMKKTRVGLHLRAVGENPSSADAAGISVTKYRYLATIIGCAIAALGGLAYFMDLHGGSIEYDIDKFGWMAVALVIFTSWKTDLGILGSILFAALYVMPNSLPVNTQAASTEILKLAPYLATIVILVITSIFNKKTMKAPAGLGNIYFREDR